jgi:plastocyanin
MDAARGGLIAAGLVLLATGPAWAACPPPPSGAVEGVVRFTGKAPPPRKLQTMDGVILHHDLVIDKKTKGLSHVVVSWLHAPAQPRAAKREAAVMDQEKLLFVPRVVAVMHGQKVRFENSDSCNHSVLATSGVKANEFNVFVTPGKPHEHAFEAQKHPVPIGCSLHPWMKAHVYVFDHPWFGVTGEKGAFRIAGLRPGKQTLWFRHAESGLNAKVEVEVKAGKTARVELEWKELPRD